MAAFIFYTVVLICIGILVRIFWIPILAIGAILFIIAGIAISAAATAFILQLMYAVCNQGIWLDFTTCFNYCAVFFTVTTLVYMMIVGDIVSMVLDFFRK